MNEVNELLSLLFLIVGGTVMLLAGVGVVRMPDLFTRMQAATKAATLGVGCMLIAVALHFGEVAVTTRALLITGFVLLTAPVAAHVIARAAHATGVPLWKGTVLDELREQRRSDAKAEQQNSDRTEGQPSNNAARP